MSGLIEISKSQGGGHSVVDTATEPAPNESPLLAGEQTKTLSLSALLAAVILSVNKEASIPAF